MPRRRIKRLSLPRRRAATQVSLPRNPILDDIDKLDDFIERGLAHGATVPELMAKVLPSIQDEWKARAARNRQERDEMVAARMARKAALDDPEKRERERQRFQTKLRNQNRSNDARDRRIERKAAKRAAALAANPTLAWRKPRRKGWHPPADTSTPS